MWTADKVAYRNVDTFTRAYKGTELLWYSNSSITIFYYTSTDGELVNIGKSLSQSFSFSPFIDSDNRVLSILSNTYENGIGTLVVNGIVDGIEGNLIGANGVSSIEDNAERARLASFNIVPTVTRLGDNVFWYSSITSIMLPSNIVYIGNDGFRYSTISSMTVLPTTPPTLKSSYNSLVGTTGPIYVPSESVETYKTTSRWSNYKTRIEAIPE